MPFSSDDEIVSKVECETILRNALNANKKVVSYEVIPIGNEVVGFLGEYYKLCIRTDSDSKISESHVFFIKANGIKDKSLNAVLNELGAFDKERSFYATIFKDLAEFCVKKWHADSFYTRSDLIVMEDLSIYGYKPLPGNEPFNETSVRVVLKSLAKMHANFIIFETKTGVAINDKYSYLQHEFSLVPGNPWMVAGISAIKSVFLVHPKYQTEAFQLLVDQKIQSALEEIYRIMKPSDKFYNTFVHRDVWGKNILFKFNEEGDVPSDCLFVDYQLSRCLPPAVDVLSFIHFNTRKSLRGQKLDEWLRCYYETLKELTEESGVGLNDIMTWEEFLGSCDYVKTLVLFCTTLYTPVTFASEKFYSLKLTHPDKFERYVIVDRSGFILDQLDQDPSYKDYVFEVIEEFFDHIFQM